MPAVLLEAFWCVGLLFPESVPPECVGEFTTVPGPGLWVPPVHNVQKTVSQVSQKRSSWKKMKDKINFWSENKKLFDDICCSLGLLWFDTHKKMLFVYKYLVKCVKKIFFSSDTTYLYNIKIFMHFGLHLTSYSFHLLFLPTFF